MTVHNIDLHIFCADYKEERMRENGTGAFILCFARAEGVFSTLRGDAGEISDQLAAALRFMGLRQLFTRWAQ